MVCFKLIKWTALGLAGTAAAAYFVFGEHTASYVGTMASSVRDTVRGKIPVEFEIKRAESMVRDIEPQIEACRRDVARAEVELAELEQQIEELTRAVTRDERKLKAGREVLAGGTNAEPVYELAGRRYDRHRVEVDLARTLEVHKNNVTILRSKTALRDRQAQAVDAARARLEAVRTQKNRLEDQIATLKIQKQTIDAMAASSSHRFDFDTSALSKAKEVISKVKKELDIAQRIIEEDLFQAQGAITEVPAGMDVVKEIDAFFAEQSAAAVAPADAAPATGKLAPRDAGGIAVEVR
ncbi:MAG TPA: hypothetical protein VK081_01145 [Planctomycetota bacterium]|nr:hypothetical protein [Planctomycetota bacterium]